MSVIRGQRLLALSLLVFWAPPFAVSACAQRAGAAPPAARGAITGTVTDTSLRPIAGADVMVVGTSSRLTADADGRFNILEVPPGEFLVWVRRLGDRPVSSVVHVEPGDTLRLAYILESALTELNPVVVTEKLRSPKMAEFDQRRRAGFGEFLDQAQIETLNFAQVEAVIRTFKAVRVIGGSVESAREPVGVPPCPMQVYLDGMPRGSGLGDLPSPQEIAGIEVYAGPATTPLWLPTGGANGRGGKRLCGVILLWTRDGR